MVGQDINLNTAVVAYERRLGLACRAVDVVVGLSLSLVERIATRRPEIASMLLAWNLWRGAIPPEVAKR